MNHFRLYASVKHMPRFLPKPCFYSRSSFNQGTIKDKKESSARENIKEISVENPFNDKRRFSLIQPRSSKSLCDGRGAETGNHTETSFEKLGSGMIILKNNISLSDQVEIVNLCQKLSFNVSAFEECISNGEKLGFHKMLLGRRWHHEKHYSFTITVPDKFISLVKSSIQDCRSHLNTKDEKISVCSNNCIVKFYTNTGHLTHHEVREDDFWYSYRTKGWPVVSMFIGDSAEFFCSDSRNVNEADKVWLESGDVLIFSNKSRDISLGLHRIIPNSAPLPFLEESMLKPGLLNLSFRRF